MKMLVRPTGRVLGTAGIQLLSNNIEAYENTIPSMLSDRLRNPKFSGPENRQTGIAPEWEPLGNSMPGFSCRLVPGQYLSGQESQLIHNYSQDRSAGIVQAGVRVRKGEEFEVEMWARVQHRPVTVTVELRFAGRPAPEASRGRMEFDQAHWHRRTCRIASLGEGAAFFQITVPGDSRLFIDQVHLRPAGEPHVGQALVDAFDRLPCPVLRFPGGCVSCTYHWQHGTGPVHLRPVCDDPVFKYKVHYDFGTDEYLELCAAKGIRPFITLNTTTATPEDAAAWAAYVRDWYVSRGLAVPAAYFMFGNENYGAWELGHMTGAMYARQLREFVPPVRRAYPEARMLAIGEFESMGIRDEQKTPWRSVVMKEAAGLFDALVVTRYAGAPDSLTRAESMAAVADHVADKAADLARQAATLREAGLRCTMGVVEWNYWTRASHHDHAGFFEPNDIRHCLYAAGFLHALARMGDIVETANFYSLVNTMGMIHVHDGAVTLTDLVKVFNLYAEALPGDVLELEVDTPALTEKSRAADALFLRGNGRTFAFLVNFSATDPAEATLEGLGAVRDARGLSSNAILAPVDEFRPSVAGARVTLPPMSLARLEMGP